MTTAKSPTERFVHWVNTRAGNQRRASKILDISTAYVCKLYNGRSTPELDIAFRIEDVTKGVRGCAIRAREWLAFEPTPVPVSKRASADRKSAERAS
jgi:hypothetical protein